MQTNFTAEQLEDPRLAEADRILRRCVHCGLCTATCPTYVLLGDERDSPRGRIYLIKDMLETGNAPSMRTRYHIDRCLSCLSCMTTCPSGVDYMHLVDTARVYIAERSPRSPRDRFIRRLLARVVPYPHRFRMALRAAPFGRPFRGLLRRTGLKALAAMVDMAPTALPPTPRFEGPGTAATKQERKGRVILLAGCAQQVLRPSINDATIRLLAARGIDVVVSNGAGCCGALTHHLGEEADALHHVRRNVHAWTKEIGKAETTAIIVNASGCGTMVKDYGYLLRNDPLYAEKAAKISALARDVCEYLAEADIGAASRWSSIRVAYHAACSLQHGQSVVDEPRALLHQAGFSLAEVPEGHICCGSAGTYNILQPELAAQLKDRKIANILSTKPDVIAAGNIGCITQLQGASHVPIVHTVELLDWAYGGPTPPGLEHLAQFVTDVPQPQRVVEDFIAT